MQTMRHLKDIFIGHLRDTMSNRTRTKLTQLSRQPYLRRLLSNEALSDSAPGAAASPY